VIEINYAEKQNALVVYVLVVEIREKKGSNTYLICLVWLDPYVMNLGMSFQFMHSSVNWNTVQEKTNKQKLKEKTKGKERVKDKECAL